jgi:hypothetical protein
MKGVVCRDPLSDLASPLNQSVGVNLSIGDAAAPHRYMYWIKILFIFDLVL